MADIESLLKEKRSFKPSSEFTRESNWNKRTTSEYRKLGEKNPTKFWAKMAKENVDWFTPWKKVLDWKPPFAKWFVGAKTNVSYNCLDRHLEGPNAWRKNKAAIIWEGEPGDTRVITYAELHKEVCRFANVLKAQGIKKGDRVCLYMPMVPELAIAMLACTRIGAPHSIVFGGFSADALSDRINDAEAKLVVTADGGYRKGAPFGLKELVDGAAAKSPCVERVIVVERTKQNVDMKSAWPRSLVARSHGRSEHPLPSGESSTPNTRSSFSIRAARPGNPKGILHTTRRLSHPRYDDLQGDLRHQGRRRLLVHRRYRLDHRPLLCRIRPARKRRDDRHVRRNADASGPGPLVVVDRKVGRVDSLHCPRPRSAPSSDSVTNIRKSMI